MIPIVRSLMFHDTVAEGQWDASGFRGAWSNHYKFTLGEFDTHLDAIAHRWRGQAPGGIPEAPGEGVPLLITFDDGGAGNIDAAAALEKRGWKGCFFVTTGKIGEPGFLNATDIRRVAAAGHVVGSHSVSHPTRMAALTIEQVSKEWRESLDALEQILGRRVDVASIPGGYYSRSVGETAASAGIRHLFNSEPVERVEEIGQCRVYGRYAIHRGHRPDDTGAYAAGDWLACNRTRLWWGAKKVAKAAGGPIYLAAARLVRR